MNILLTGGGAPGAAGILKCLHQDPSFHVIVADARGNAVGKYLNNDFEKIPAAIDPLFVETVLEVCKKNKIKILLPLVTRELLPLAEHKKTFESIGTKLLVSPPEALSIANNKASLYEFLQWRGIPVPEFRVVETVEQFEQALNELGYPGKEVCIKPSISNGSRGFRIVTEKINESDLLFNHKPTTTYIRKDDILRILSSSPFPQLLVCEYLPGPEYSIDCLANHGVPVIIVPRTRDRMINGISVEGRFEKNEKIIAYAENIIRALKLHGNIGIQVKAAVSGEYLALEINPRLQGTVSAALGAGINFPVLAVKQELDLPITPGELFVKWETGFTRYWNEVFHKP